MEFVPQRAVPPAEAGDVAISILLREQAAAAPGVPVSRVLESTSAWRR